MRDTVAALVESILANPEDHKVSEVVLAMHLADRTGLNVPHRLWDLRPLYLEALEHEPEAGEGGR